MFKFIKLHLFRVMQEQVFVNEIMYSKISKGNNIADLVRSLNLFVDSDGLLRTDGRIASTSGYEYGLIYPILIAKHHSLNELIINDCHNRCKHVGINATVTKLRMPGFWVPQARQAVKSVISRCFMCKKFNYLAFRYPKITNLPRHRVNLVRPFLQTGIDYTGHLSIKQKTDTSKMYILVFTCLSIRVVHIKLIEDMSSTEFVQALIRFTNVHGIPSHIYSDNARSFSNILGDNIIEQHVYSANFKKQFENYKIKHIKIPLYSSWVGSTWERLIRVIKSRLYKTIGHSKIEYFKLLTYKMLLIRGPKHIDAPLIAIYN